MIKTIAKTLEMRRCKCIFLVPDGRGILTGSELTVDIPERLMYKKGATAEYTAEYYGIDAESIFRIESLENAPRKIRFEISTADFIKNAIAKED